MAPTLTLVNGPRLGRPRPATPTTQLENSTTPYSISHYPHIHGDHHPLAHSLRLMVEVLSSTLLRFSKGDAVSGLPGLIAVIPSSGWILNISIVPLWCE